MWQATDITMIVINRTKYIIPAYRAAVFQLIFLFIISFIKYVPAATHINTNVTINIIFIIVFIKINNKGRTISSPAKNFREDCQSCCQDDVEP